MSWWAIRHKPSGTLFSLFPATQRRGSTFLEPPFTGVPRLFKSRAAANSCLRWWLGGKAVPIYDDEPADSIWKDDIKVGATIGKGDPTRRSEDMELVEVDLTIKAEQP